MLESQKGDVIDVRTETVSKNWMTAYWLPGSQGWSLQA